MNCCSLNYTNLRKQSNFKSLNLQNFFYHLFIRINYTMENITSQIMNTFTFKYWNSWICTAWVQMFPFSQHIKSLTSVSRLSNRIRKISCSFSAICHSLGYRMCSFTNGCTLMGWQFLGYCKLLLSDKISYGLRNTVAIPFPQLCTAFRSWGIAHLS